ncbi:hypothetical protein [Paractinoplanes toevensis]|uniref:Uncharacterized protein n=1 Tax=Paractinoplanes toevensis TaxID=571911 RepID=A0A919T5U0_9ACTN|nr:hypothetical protein [Actinoplanes toevensis]GIM89580.1 hypothetical protein Ato02nite_013730 [Actinoplanes toevensis]
MRWFRRTRDERLGQQDVARRVMIDDVRQRFGVGRPGSFHQQAAAVAEALTGPDGVAAAAGIVHEFADSAHAEIQRLAAELSRQVRYQFVVDRANYRPMWREATPDLRWPLFDLPCGLFPYIHVAGAVQAISAQVKSTTDQNRLHDHLFEILDLTIAGWEFGSVRVDTDGAALAGLLISTARDLRTTMSKEPPLPPPVRELMRRNNTIDVYAPDAHRIVGGINPGRELREILLA